MLERSAGAGRPGAVSISLALLLGLAVTQSAALPPAILFIAREPLVAGREDTYREIEEETARLSASLGCPHPYLAMESLTGPREIWWFNGFDSPEEEKQVAEAYEKNRPFAAMLEKNRQRKASATGKVVEIHARYRPDLSGGAPWILGRARFLVITVTKVPPSGQGSVFQAADGTLLVFSPARTRPEADRLAAATPGSTVVVARPRLSFPAKDWVESDPQFWGATAR